MKNRIPILLVLVVLSLISIWYFSDQGHDQSSEVVDYGLVFADLIDQINDVNEIRISTSDDQYSVTYQNGKWRIDKFDFYPTRPSMVPNFLIGFAQLRKTEKKTSDPGRFASIDLEGQDVAESRSTQVELLAQSNSVLASLLVGKRRSSVRDILLTEFHVREPEQNQTWLAQSRLTIPGKAIDWLDTQIIDMDRRIAKVVIESTEKEPVSVFRSEKNSKAFSLDKIPASHKIRYQFALNDIGRIFHRLSFDEVRRVSDWQTDITVSAQTYDGLKIVALFGRGELSHFVQVSAQVIDDASENLYDEAAMLNRRWTGWMYRISDVRRKTAELTREELLEPVTVDPEQ